MGSHLDIRRYWFLLEPGVRNRIVSSTMDLMCNDYGESVVNNSAPNN